ncbi:F0F1 ATP synthase subunit gamma [Blattabacterium cuenoti]|uniref:F0F1 ATP synthase subunit gamma n=1 Tax=Blattabacterium cuenoti TaxID=1653831 RepID=UPI00163D0E81|nr:FoF1 ATP synthase subunit gamma [Blattabacterium cuenoti]
MSNSKEIKRKIVSMDSVIKTTNAMKMISVVKLKKIKIKIRHIQIYWNHIKSIFINILFFKKLNKSWNNSKYFINKKLNKKLFIVFSSEKGLCGSFNSSIFDQIDDIIQNNRCIHYQCSFIPIGNKVIDFLSKKYEKHIFHSIEKFSLKNDTNFIQSIINYFFQNFHSVYVIYNKLKNSLNQNTIVEKILPISISDFLIKKEDHIPPILEPNQEYFIDYMIPKFIQLKLKKIFLDSSYAENTLRMISMHKASENASNIKKKLILDYNKERQNIITKEILEIIGGLESLKNKN